MEDEHLLQRIVLDSRIMVGQPAIQGSRLTVDYILNLLAHGSTEDEILAEYPSIARDDIRACLLFATKTLKNTEFMPFPSDPVS